MSSGVGEQIGAHAVICGSNIARDNRNFGDCSTRVHLAANASLSRLIRVGDAALPMGGACVLLIERVARAARCALRELCARRLAATVELQF